MKMSGFRSDSTQLKDLRITGNGSSGGGQYDKVKILGDSVIHGDVKCNLFKCTGTVSVEGFLESGNVGCQGNMKVLQGLQGQEVSIQGELDVIGDVSVQTLKVNGEIRVEGHLNAEKLKGQGSLNISGDCQGEEVIIRGSLDVANMLNGEVVEIKLYGPSRAREIGGGKITITKAMTIPFIGKYSPGAYGAMQADSIEGDEIHLENTKAAVVRGRNVYIGSGCEIGLVEYKNEYKQDQGAVVVQYNRI
ncbi:hypothetical protein [Paenibacillus antarcticus]|uniref:Cell shape determination protein CcmA n=1 Tax=Paenibacillus antarcticus TaxID=253703 RepID=A0A162K212_9BACL|nr:hypothetical protein [Paenibacillus antarcticus]OAB41836.1 hypothetical protein PBAT_20875 [Paenibacillus antarcticus]